MNYIWNQLHSRNSLLYASILVTTRMEVSCFIVLKFLILSTLAIWNQSFIHSYYLFSKRKLYFTKRCLDYKLNKKLNSKRLLITRKDILWNILYDTLYLTFPFFYSVLFWLFDSKYGQFPYWDQVQYFHSWVLSKSKREFLYLVESILRFRLL